MVEASDPAHGWPELPAVAGEGWGRELHRARVASGVPVNEVAAGFGVAEARIAQIVAELEALSEPLTDPGKRNRAHHIIAGFGLDPAAFGLEADA